MASYSLSKSKSILKQHWKIYKRKKSKLSIEVSGNIQSIMMELQESILNRDRQQAHKYARKLEQTSKIYLKKSFFEQITEGSLGLIFALIIAIVIRQTAFELFEIPSGSMRPTFKEQDRLIVSKTQFGLNVPLTTSHLLFKPEEVKRMGAVIFTGENMDIPNVKTRYFYLFPGHKQYIKRMIGLPGDTLYFYGGKIYGIDQEGKDISKNLQLEEFSYLEHIPFIHIEGKASTPNTPTKEAFSPVILSQMNTPLAKLYLSSKKNVHYEMLYKADLKRPSNSQPLDLYNLWGMENFANARILKRDILEKKKDLPVSLPSSGYYLELTHHPSIAKAQIQRDPYNRIRPMASTEKSYIPLKQSHLESLWNNLYTGRIIVKNGKLTRYGAQKNSIYAPKFKEAIPDGTYEFINGKLYEIKAQGITIDAPINHPLAQFSIDKLYLLFNAGIECDSRFIPHYHDQNILPSRYAYFRNHNLYIMGAQILSQNDPTLKKYISTEKQRQTSNPSYTPFLDRGPPLKKDGALDIDKIKAYGITVPKKHYLVLGDNHAMSGDSREFGFVPQDNLRGTPLFMFWAPGGRFGSPNHGIYHPFTTPRAIVWILFLTGGGIWAYRHYRKDHPPLPF